MAVHNCITIHLSVQPGTTPETFQCILEDDMRRWGFWGWLGQKGEAPMNGVSVPRRGSKEHTCSSHQVKTQQEKAICDPGSKLSLDIRSVGALVLDSQPQNCEKRMSLKPLGFGSRPPWVDQGRRPCLLQEASVFDYHCWNLLLLPHPQKYKHHPLWAHHSEHHTSTHRHQTVVWSPSTLGSEASAWGTNCCHTTSPRRSKQEWETLEQSPFLLSNLPTSTTNLLWLKKKKFLDALGIPVVGNLPVRAEVAGLIPVPEWFHKMQVNWAGAPQLLSPWAATTEAHAPRAGVPQQENPLQWDALARMAPRKKPPVPQLEKSPHKATKTQHNPK